MKFLLIVLLAIAAVTANEHVCKPKTQFKKYCNTCACASDGLSFACTRMMCDHEIWNEDGSLKIVHPSNRVARSVSEQVCKPSSEFKNYCNTCFCADDGSYFTCTRQMCDPEIWNEDGSLKTVPESNRVTRSVSEQVCKPRSQFKQYCNTCACADDGLSFACTRRMCDPEIWNEDGSLKIDHALNRVARSVSDQVCKPRSQFKQYCNTCACADDGLSFACTRRMCDPEIWNEDGSLKIDHASNRVARSESKQVCKPLSQFKNYCNSCTCSEDGLSFACTRMMCDKEIWNEDGSLRIKLNNA